MRGCHTKEDIIDNEVIIDIPLKCLITVEMGKETDVCLYFMCNISPKCIVLCVAV